ncbi:MAG: phage major capsid protein, partial [Gemmatimonadaceae bacterium]|nr:phage major capsid protein [Gemmatimonadaceae bacterium]
MAGTLTTLDAITKKFYVQNDVVSQISESSFLYDKLAKPAKKEVMGKDYTYAIRTADNRYAGRPIAEAGNYGTVGNQGVENVVVPNTRLITAIELSMDVVNAATGANRGAFISAFTLETEGGMKNTVRALNRQLQGDGRDALAFWTGADDTSGTNVDDGQGNGFPIHLQSGATTLDLIDATNNSSVLGDSIVVTKGAETSTNCAITWTGSVSGSADADYLVHEDSLGKAAMGIRGIISDDNPPLLSGGLHGLTVAAQPDWKAQVFGNSGANRPLTLALMQQPLTEIGLRSSASEADIEFLMCNGRLKDKYIELLIADQRQTSPTKLKGGYVSFDFNGKPIVVDNQCRRNTLYYINPDTMDFLTATNGIAWSDFSGNR